MDSETRRTLDRGRVGRPVEEVADERLAVSANVGGLDHPSSDPAVSLSDGGTHFTLALALWSVDWWLLTWALSATLFAVVVAVYAWRKG